MLPEWRIAAASGAIGGKGKDKPFAFRNQKKGPGYSHFGRYSVDLSCMFKPVRDSTFAPSGSVRIHIKTGSPKQAAAGAGYPADL